MAKRMYRGGEDARRGRPVLSGLMIGLIVGLMLAIAVALWVKASNPFKSSDKLSSQAPSPPVQNAPPEPEKAPSYDFYKVLPGGDTPSAPPDPEAASPSQTQYYLQAGAFQNADEADNLKAQLALLGLEAQIKTTDVEGKGVYHRVRVGPFKAIDAVNSTRALLAQNNIEVTLVKVSPTP